MTPRVSALLAAFLAAAPARAGDVAGVVRYAGVAPPPATFEITKDRAACGASQANESLLVERGGGVANAVVALRGVPGAPPPPARLVLDQRGCRFLPRVQAAPVGSTLELVNGDPILHGVHGWLAKRTAFDVPMPEPGQRVQQPLPKPGLVRIGCDVHAWMQAFVWVVDGPAAVSARDGTFRIAGLPPGTYAVTAWHERLGERTAQVTVPASGDVQLSITFDAR